MTRATTISLRAPWLLLLAGLLLPSLALGHNLSESNASFVEQLNGPAVVPFVYLGAKHMFTGYDHVLFLIGVLFFLAKPRDVVLYVSLFTIGHSITLLAGVLAGWQANAYLVDAMIGLSVVYKAFENMGGFDGLPFQIDSRIAVTVFGLFHGLGLATRLQELTLTEDGLVTNLLSFNLGVELGQIAALAVVLFAAAALAGERPIRSTGVCRQLGAHDLRFSADRDAAGRLLRDGGARLMRLFKATLLSIGVAAVVLITVVLPAEFDLDPLGTGAALGLTGLSRTEPDALIAQPSPHRRETMVFELSPFESVEYKYRLEQGAGLVFSWHATGEVVFDFHAEPDGAEAGYAEGFEQGRDIARNGTYVAPFSGIHGWFWENRGTDLVVVTLHASGFADGASLFRDNDALDRMPPPVDGSD